MALKPILLIALNKDDSTKFIKRNKLDRSKISIIIKESDIINLTKGHKLIETKLAYINSEYNAIISEFTSKGYKVKK